MSTGYKAILAFLFVLLLFVSVASYYGWGLTPEAQEKAKSVRLGSWRTRLHFGGGTGSWFGK